MTTKLGAEAGFTFLWFVLVSCFLKVVVQTELARHTISSGQTFLRVFNDLPGPSAPRPLWLTLRWLTVVVGACVVAVAIFVNIEVPWQTVPVAFGMIIAVITVASAAAMWEAKRHGPHVGGSGPSGNRPKVNWFMWLWLASMLLVFVNSGAILGGAGQTLQMV